jgi:hypothetical protein
MYMRYLHYAILLCLVVLLIACGADPTPEQSVATEPPPTAEQSLATEPTPTPEPQPSATIAAQTEETFDSPLSPLPTPEAALAVPTQLPALQDDLGGLTGRFVDVVSGEPIIDRVVYLGELTPMESQDGEDATNFVMMVPTTSPSSPLDQSGGFAFVNVEPGTYAFVLWTPGESWVVNEPGTQSSILVTIEAGQITDLDVVAIEGRR